MSYTCPRCGMTSHSIHDEWYGYCGNCHDYTREEPVADDDTAAAKLNKKLKDKHGFRRGERQEGAREDPPQDQDGGES